MHPQAAEAAPRVPRLFGTQLAEMPFVATRQGFQRAGHCRRLIKARHARHVRRKPTHPLLRHVVHQGTRLWHTRTTPLQQSLA